MRYADTVWDPYSRAAIHQIELVQNDAICFIANLKGRGESVSSARGDLGLETLECRRESHRLCLLARILTNEDRHNVLVKAYDEILQDRKDVTMTTRAANRGCLNSMAAHKEVYHQSFLPRTIRDMRVCTTEAK